MCLSEDAEKRQCAKMMTCQLVTCQLVDACVKKMNEVSTGAVYSINRPVLTMSNADAMKPQTEVFDC